jgi:tRNA (Thr-GGU) A37 N-methylase
LDTLRRDVGSELQFIGVVEKAGEHEAHIRVFEDYCAGLRGAEEYSHLIILYWLHVRDNLEDRQTLLVIPKEDSLNVERRVFACRSPCRPDPIGLCVTRLLKAEECRLT